MDTTFTTLSTRTTRTAPRFTRATATTETPPASWRDRTGRAILGVCAVGAFAATAATAATAGEVADAEGALQVAETWRLVGLPLFAGVFLILAAAPRRVAGLWELVIVNKLALVVAGATYLSDTDGGRDFVFVDGTLVALLATAYVLVRGWTAWSRR